jgi:chemotaxis protein methyltransferase CheR
MSLPLSPEVFRIFCSLIEERTGIHYELGDLEILADKLSARAVERELPSLLDYYYFLRYDAAAGRELDALVETLVVQETYLFRELDQLRALVDRLLPSFVAARAPSPVRIWCAACASGEEPVTLAVLLRDAGRLGQVELVASDISARALAKAEAGVFRGRSLRVLDAQPARAAFQRAADGSVRVDAEISARIRWLRLNLCDAAAIATLGRFDAIICRNVLIYFGDRTTARVAGSLADALRPGGVLLVGASESLLRFGTALVCEEHGGAFMYRKPAS